MYINAKALKGLVVSGHSGGVGCGLSCLKKKKKLESDPLSFLSFLVIGGGTGWG